ncbi:MAG: ABC transporter ATP-binding protein [Leptolyngbya sp. PLA1]|nr:ABC transporter ATP-binding protein [Leptolyngbya sp. PLA1]
MNGLPAPSDAPRAPLLRVRGLGVDVGGRAVVRGASFDVVAGRTLAIVGESGSGKSMTALALMGLLPPGAGAVGSARLAGRSGEPDLELVGLAPEHHRRLRGGRLAMIFQEPMTALNPVMTIGEQIDEVFRCHAGLTPREARAASEAALVSVSVPDAASRLNDYPHQFSGGMRQRVLIAMALAGRPGVLFADEPTTALDASLRAGVLDLLNRQRSSRGLGVVLISHDLRLVAGHADEVLVMYAGYPVEAGPAAAVLREPLHPYTRCLVGCLPDATTRGRRLATLADLSTAERERTVLGRRPWWPEAPGPAEWLSASAERFVSVL